MANTNLEVSRAYSRAWYHAHREHVLAYHRRRRQLHRKKLNARTRELYYKNHEHVKAYKRLASQKAGRKIKEEVLTAYGSKCACCGETVAEFLTVDHVNNDGAAHRKEVGEGKNMYFWLKRHGFPKDNFRLLCYNCNCARGHLGYCPHEKSREVGGKEV